MKWQMAESWLNNLKIVECMTLCAVVKVLCAKFNENEFFKVRLCYRPLFLWMFLVISLFRLDVVSVFVVVFVQDGVLRLDALISTCFPF